MKKIYWHIGPWKTGTTSIQYFLFSNRELFNEKGYGLYYARNPIMVDSNVDPVVDYLQENGYSEWFNKSFREYLYSTDFDYYIFSEECYYLKGKRGIDMDMMRVLKENDVTIILYARRIDNISLSLWPLVFS